MLDTTTIYADYQATTPVDKRVATRMAPCWSEFFGNPHSSDHIVGWRANAAVCESAEAVSALIGCDVDEIVFTSGATEANNLALLGLARRAPKSRHRILVGATEHKCTLTAARALSEREGFIVETVPVNQEGLIDLDTLSKRLDETALMASFMAVNNEVGTIQDIAQISELLTSRGVLFHCDAVQAPCAMDIGDLATHADLISLSGHKMYGPQGIGALYIRRTLHERIEPIIYGGNQQNGLRSGTIPMPLCVGMGAAAKIVTSDQAIVERKRIAHQRDTFVRLLHSGKYPISVNGIRTERRHPGNANIRFDGFSSQDILSTLQPKLAASTGAACSSGIPEPSHVLCALGLSMEQSDASVRFSFGRFTTDREIETAARLVLEALDSLSYEK